MRTVVTALLWLVTTLATIVTIGASWSAVHLQSEDGFVQLASRVGTDAEVQQAAADLAGEAFADQQGVPELFRDRVRDLVTRGVLQLTQSAGWDEAWQETVRRSHQHLFAGPTPTTVQVDIAPIAGLALDEVTSALPVDLAAPDELFVTVSDQDPSQFVRSVGRSSTVAVVAGGTALIAGLLALAVARRRSTTFAMLGAGVMLSAAFWWLAGRQRLPRLMDRFDATSDDARALHEVLSDRVVASLDSTLVWVAGAGAAMVLVGLLSRAAASRA